MIHDIVIEYKEVIGSFSTQKGRIHGHDWYQIARRVYKAKTVRHGYPFGIL